MICWWGGIKIWNFDRFCKLKQISSGRFKLKYTCTRLCYIYPKWSRGKTIHDAHLQVMGIWELFSARWWFHPDASTLTHDWARTFNFRRISTCFSRKTFYDVAFSLGKTTHYHPFLEIKNSHSSWTMLTSRNDRSLFIEDSLASADGFWYNGNLNGKLVVFWQKNSFLRWKFRSKLFLF